MSRSHSLEEQNSNERGLAKPDGAASSRQNQYKQVQYSSLVLSLPSTPSPIYRNCAYGTPLNATELIQCNQFNSPGPRPRFPYWPEQLGHRLGLEDFSRLPCDPPRRILRL